MVAHHAAERMSKSYIGLGLVFLVSFIFGVSSHFPSIGMNLLFTLPNSREQEVSVLFEFEFEFN